MKQCKKFNHPVTAVFRHFQLEDEEADPSTLKPDPHYFTPDPTILEPDPHNLKPDPSILKLDPHNLKPDPLWSIINPNSIPINRTA